MEILVLDDVRNFSSEGPTLMVGEITVSRSWDPARVDITDGSYREKERASRLSISSQRLVTCMQWSCKYVRIARASNYPYIYAWLSATVRGALHSARREHNAHSYVTCGLCARHGMPLAILSQA